MTGQEANLSERGYIDPVELVCGTACVVMLLAMIVAVLR